MENISLTPDIIFSIGGVIPVTSAHLGLFIISLFLIVWGIYIGKTAKIIPSAGQMVIEAIVNWFSEMIDSSIINKKVAQRVAPMIITFFIIILLSNLFGLYPILGSIVMKSSSAKEALTTALKTPTSHLSMTLAFTLITLAFTHITALSIRPLRHIGNYIKIEPFFKIKSMGDFANALLELFLGLLDIVGEIAKIVSLSCRLFGNVLAGELMALVIMSLAVFTQFIIPIPFIVLALFSGIIQAAVFTLLSIQYISLAVSSLEDTSEEQPLKSQNAKKYS